MPHMHFGKLPKSLAVDVFLHKMNQRLIFHSKTKEEKSINSTL